MGKRVELKYETHLSELHYGGAQPDMSVKMSEALDDNICLSLSHTI